MFDNPVGHPKTLVTCYPWALTDAGSVTMETRPGNNSWDSGIVLIKAYNKNKEQFATPFKGHYPFKNELYELFGYSEAQMKINATGRVASNIPTTFSRDWVLKQWQDVKERVFAVLDSTKHRSYSDRQEFRTTLDFYEALDGDLFSITGLDQIRDADSSHRSFWILSTEHVNNFRLAECNRWILCMEQLITAVEFTQGTKKTITVTEQQTNSLMSTTLARLLSVSLGCLNPELYPSIWLGKRWTKGRVFKQHGATQRQRRTWQKRQGLEVKNSVKLYGMAWLPHRLGVWSANEPFFRINRYHHLDVAYNIINRNQRGLAHLHRRIREGRMREHISRLIAETDELPERAQTVELTRLFSVLSEMVVQSYNLFVLDRIQTLWYTHMGIRPNPAAFKAAAQLSPDAEAGVEILCYDTVRRCLVDNLGMGEIHCAYVKSGASEHFTGWESGMWIDRLKPLFSETTAESPNWLRQSPFNKKAMDIITTIKASVAPEFHDWTVSLFYKQLHQTLGLCVHAALHYDKSKSANLVKGNPSGNSAATYSKRKGQSLLERTKWMFPKFKPEDAVMLHRGTNDAEPTLRKCAHALIEMRVLNEKDRCSDVERVPRLMSSRATLNGALSPSMTSLKLFYEQFDDYTEELEEFEADEGAESDWPPIPSQRRSVSAHSSGSEDSSIE